MVKNTRINMRISEYTDDLIAAMVDKTDLDKSKVIRDAIEYYAIHVLGQDEVMNLRLYKHFEG